MQAASIEAQAIPCDEYATVRHFVKRIINLRNSSVEPLTSASKYWNDFVDHFSYVFELPASELKRIRRHTYHLTSDNYQTYYFAKPEYRQLLERGYQMFAEKLLPFNHFESLNGIGVNSSLGKISHDLLRYLGTLCDLFESQAISPAASKKILEIGGGYGGLARAVITFSPLSSYLICDLEETLFFSGVYLQNEFGADRVHLICDGSALNQLLVGHFYLLPQSALNSIKHLAFDLAINQQSMQEMTAAQVLRYVSFLKQNCHAFYNCNLSSHDAALVAEKNLVTNLNQFLRSHFNQELWRAQPPTTSSSFGDHLPTIERFVVKV